ncbi:MAG: preprotein translocase subunit SecG [Bacillariaceae sp.]|jgi:preprotein translocase subunit SecG
MPFVLLLFIIAVCIIIIIVVIINEGYDVVTYHTQGEKTS